MLSSLSTFFKSLALAGLPCSKIKFEDRCLFIFGLPNQGDMTFFCNRPNIIYYQNSFDPDNRNAYEVDGNPEN